MGKIISLSGSTRRTSTFLKRMQDPSLYASLNGLAQRGVSALQAYTPQDSGLTASSWAYEIRVEADRTTISWTNSNVVDGTPVAILLQYGHGTGTGGFVAGQDYINPAIKPIFDEIADDVWKKVTFA